MLVFYVVFTENNTFFEKKLPFIQVPYNVFLTSDPKRDKTIHVKEYWLKLYSIIILTYFIIFFS